MNSTTFHLEARPELEKRLADLSARGPNGTLKPVPEHLYAKFPKDDLGGAGAFSTVSDVMKLLTALLEGDARILAPATMEEMFKPQLENSAYINENLADPNFSMGMTTDLPPNTVVNHGLAGLLVTEGLATGRQQGSLQWGGLPNLSWVSHFRSDTYTCTFG